MDQIIEEALAFPHQQSVAAFQAQVDVCLAHNTVDRLSRVAVPTLVLAGERDVILPPRFGHAVADAIPTRSSRRCGTRRISRSRRSPTSSTRVDAFWQRVEARN